MVGGDSATQITKYEKQTLRPLATLLTCEPLDPIREHSWPGRTCTGVARGEMIPWNGVGPGGPEKDGPWVEDLQDFTAQLATCE